MTERIIAAGQSHLRALVDAYVATPTGDPLPAEFSFATSRPQRLFHTVRTEDGPDRRPVTGSLPDLIRDWRASHVAVVWGGNQMNVRSLVAVGPRFDVVLPSGGTAPATGEDVEVIPCSVVHAAVRERLDGNEVLAALDEAATTLGLPVCVVGPPPPIPATAVRDRLEDSPHFVQVLATTGQTAADVALVPDDVRYRLWSLMEGAYRSFAEERSWSFVRAPDGCHDGDGMLGEAFWGTDATHANAAYGSLVLAQLAAWATAGEP